MRELKFRMFTQTTGKFLGYADVYDLLRNGSDVLSDFEEAVLGGVEFEQYTGLKDKNGKEIYEGDIVKVEAFGRVYQVVYRKWDCSFVFENDEDEDIVSIFEGFSDKYEVIGNIHETVLPGNTKKKKYI